MKTIYRYDLEITDYQDIILQIGHKFLDFQLKDGEISFWAEVDNEANMTSKRFYMYGTGHPVGDEVSYLATVQQPPFVWHIYQDND